MLCKVPQPEVCPEVCLRRDETALRIGIGIRIWKIQKKKLFETL